MREAQGERDRAIGQEDVISLLPAEGPRDAEDDDGGRTRSQAAYLLRLAEQHGLALFHDDSGEAFASIASGETWPVMSRHFERWLRGVLFVDGKGSVARSSVISEVVLLCEARALYAGEERPIFVRVGLSPPVSEGPIPTDITGARVPGGVGQDVARWAGFRAAQRYSPGKMNPYLFRMARPSGPARNSVNRWASWGFVEAFMRTPACSSYGCASIGMSQ